MWLIVITRRVHHLCTRLLCHRLEETSEDLVEILNVADDTKHTIQLRTDRTNIVPVGVRFRNNLSPNIILLLLYTLFWPTQLSHAMSSQPFRHRFKSFTSSMELIVTAAFVSAKHAVGTSIGIDTALYASLMG